MSILTVLFWIAVVILALVAVLAYYLVVRQRVLEPISVSQLTIEPATLIYTPYRGDYMQMMPTVEEVKSDINAFCRAHGLAGLSSDKLTMCGVYYDNPHTLADSKQARAVLGVLARDTDGTGFDAAAFHKWRSPEKKRQYSALRLPRLPAFGASFPLLGMPSLMSAIIRGYPTIRAWGMEHRLMERSLCALETYEWAAGRMGICFPYGKNAESLFGLSGFPQPEIRKNIPVQMIKKRQ